MCSSAGQPRVGLGQQPQPMPACLIRRLMHDLLPACLPPYTLLSSSDDTRFSLSWWWALPVRDSAAAAAAALGAAALEDPAATTQQGQGVGRADYPSPQ